MTRSATHRIATLGLAAVAVTAIGGTVSGAGDEATTCQTWHPRVIVSGHNQHTWHPDNAIDDRLHHTLNPDVAIDGRFQHAWNPDVEIAGRYQHMLNPDVVIDGGLQHTLNPAGDHSDACPSPSPTIP
jgi:hypothetical protein